MNTNSNKLRDNKSHSMANAGSQKQNRGKSAIQIIDNRSEAIVQNKLEEIANNSQQAKQLKVYQAIANNNDPHIVQQKEVLKGEKTL